MLRLRRGDTIVEVILAFALFSLVSIATMTVMGQGTNAAQRALEITLVRQQIDAQAEALRAAQQAFVSTSGGPDTEWRKIALIGDANDSTHFASATTCPTSQAQLTRSFVMNPHTATAIVSPPSPTWYQDSNGPTSQPFAQVVTTGANVLANGMWIERDYRSGGSANTNASFDFVVRACWYAAGLNVPLQLETIVRLYEPTQ